jgi:hypothetical protein
VGHVFSLFFHFIGFGLLLTTTVAGYILNRQYKKATDVEAKLVILRSIKPIGIISPIAMLLMLITGIGNMHSLGYTLLDLPGWLAYKIILFAIAFISGILFAVKSRKRVIVFQEIATGKSTTHGEQTMASYDQQINLFYLVSAVLLALILFLSINGRLGVQ